MKDIKTRNLYFLLTALFTAVMSLSSGTMAYAQITPSQDAYTNTAMPTTNLGTKTVLDVESASQTTYIQFDLSSIPGSFTTANIAKASLKLYVNGVTTAGNFNVDLVNGSWTEKTITASLAPALGTTVASGIALSSANVHGYLVIDVTAAVDAWLDGSAPNNGLALVADSPLNASFDSKESTTTSQPPELEIVFTGGGIAGVATANGSGLMGGGTNGTLNLSLTNSCATSQILQWTGSAWACTTIKGTGTITGVTAGTDLTGGGTGGNVTLNLNTASTDKRYAQLGTANTFTGNQTVNGAFGVSGLTILFGNLIGNSANFTGVGVGQASPRALLDVVGNGSDALLGDAGCGSGYSGIGFTTSGGLSGCTNYALLGGPGGGTFLNANGTAWIHFRSNNNELATIDNSGDMNIIGQNGGGSLSVSGKVSSSNVIASVTASNMTAAEQNPSACSEATLTKLDSNCQVPNLTLTKTTTNPDVLVMVSIGGITTDECAYGNFYLFVDGKVVALSTVSTNTNDARNGNEVGSLSMMSLQNLAPGSHTFQVQATTDMNGGDCQPFTLATTVSNGDGSRGSERSLVVREF
jgi:hypothetical protein